MNWFKKITGFDEGGDYGANQSMLIVEDGCIVSADGHHWSYGRLETPTLGDLRARVAELPEASSQPVIAMKVTGDVRQLHLDPRFRGALFQVASQFNLLEMVGPSVTPEQGVTRYQDDLTQGPACAIAAGAGTTYRNYLVQIGGAIGQTSHRQIDCLADIGVAVGNGNGRLWRMRNGYVECDEVRLRELDAILAKASEQELDGLRSLLRIGLHWDLDVTDAVAPGTRVSQAYCSALPVSYNQLPAQLWARFARLVLEACYEATLLAARLNQARTGCADVLLTRVGGSAFGNAPDWIDSAQKRAMHCVDGSGLRITTVSRNS